MASVYTPHTASFLNRDAFTHREAFTHNKLLHTKSFTHSKLSHTAGVYTQNTYTQCFYTWQAFIYTHTASFLNRETFTHNKLKLLHREAFTHSKLSHTASVYTQNTHAQCFYTWQAFTHTETFTQRRFYTQRKAFTHSKLLHTKSFTHSKLLQKTVFTQRSFLVHNHNRNCSSKTGWISTPKRQKDDFAALLKRTFKRTIATAKIEKICWQITVAALMHPLQYYLRDPAAKDNSIAHAAPAPSNLDAAITMRSAETELQNTIELRATASAIAAPKLDLDATATKRRFCSTFEKNL